MDVDQELRRAAVELGDGRTADARRRLVAAVEAHPRRVDVRVALADLQRAAGHRDQAGRWSFLAEGASAHELAAFERSFPDPLDRFRVLRWPHRASTDDLGPQAQQRLGRLLVEVGPALRRQRRRAVLGRLGCVAVLVVAVLVVVGLVRLAAWVVGAVRGLLGG